jgi:hypothetical protein
VSFFTDCTAVKFHTTSAYISVGKIYRNLGSSFGCGAGSVINIEIDMEKCVVSSFFLFIVSVNLFYFLFSFM